MSATKLYDLAVSTGTYTGRDGQTKHRYQNIGAMMQSDQGRGGNFLLIEPWVNLAGLPHEPGKSILVSMFEPRQDNGGSASGSQGAEAPASKPQGADSGLFKGKPGEDFTDDIPF